MSLRTSKLRGASSAQPQPHSSTSPLYTPAALLTAYFFFSAVTLNLKKMMSPSLTTYSLPSVLYLPAFSRLGIRVSLRVGVKGTGYG